jgi:hypothetical protein
MKKKATGRLARQQKLMRAFTVETVARVLSLGRTQALVMDDEDLYAVFERMDALLFHEARNFLKLPYVSSRAKR